MVGDFIFQDNVWGETIFDYRYEILLQILKKWIGDKTQLGLMRRNHYFSSAPSHTRYAHSIGAYKVGQDLLAACKIYLKGYFLISNQEQDAFLISCLFHDVGHEDYSHASERITKISHEQRTVTIVESLKEIIDFWFGDGTCEMVLIILRNSYNIKKNIKTYSGEYEVMTEKSVVKEVYPNVNILFVLSSLLSGAIDVDRIDYIARDLLNITGERKDFRKIFTYMRLCLVDDKPKIVFLKDAVPLLEDYLIQRFRNYDLYYFHEWNNILDYYFMIRMTENYTVEQRSEGLTEPIFDAAVKNGPHVSLRTERAANALENKGNDKILQKSFKNESSRQKFISLIKPIIPMDERYSSVITRQVTIYDESKNNILIKYDEMVDDIVFATEIIQNKISKSKYQVLIDLRLLELEYKGNYKSLAAILKKLTKLFNSSRFEIEKKFIFSEEDRERLIEVIGKDKEFTFQDNYDIYSAYSNMPECITVRHRKGLEEEYTVKLKADDCTSFEKREELKMDKSTKRSVYLQTAKDLITQSGYAVDGDFHYLVTVVTRRQKFCITYNGSKLEVAFDSSKYIYHNKVFEDSMIEIELKDGDSIDLWYFARELSNAGCNITPCNESKCTRACKSLNLKRIFKD